MHMYNTLYSQLDGTDMTNVVTEKRTQVYLQTWL